MIEVHVYQVDDNWQHSDLIRKYTNLPPSEALALRDILVHGFFVGDIEYEKVYCTFELESNIIEIGVKVA